MIHVLKRLVKEKFNSCLSIFSTIGTSPPTIRQSSSGANLARLSLVLEKTLKALKLTEPHIFKGYWWVPGNPEKKVAGIVT